MKAKHRNILNEVMSLCNDLGGTLDGTSTSEAKFRDRQMGLMKVSKILYAILSDHPENENSWFDWEEAERSLSELRSLKNKTYPDRKGHY